MIAAVYGVSLMCEKLVESLIIFNDRVFGDEKSLIEFIEKGFFFMNV